MSLIKVLYHYSGSGVLTGSPGALLRMIDALDREYYLPAFIGPASGPLIDELRTRGVQLVASDVGSVSWGAPLQLASRVRAKRRVLADIGAQLVHMNEPGWNTDLVIAARMLGIPVALHLHNPQTVSRRNINYAIAKRVFLCSAGQMAVIENATLIQDKLTVLHNSVDVDGFSGGRSIRAQMGVPEDSLVIGTVAQISRRKGIDIFLEAAELLLRRHPQIKFVIAGPKATQEDAYFQAVMERMAKPPLKGSVLYLGGRKDVPDVLSSFDVFVLPTRAEPFGMVIIEAMAAGVPVVASHVGGIPEIVTSPAIGRTVSDMSPEAFASAMDELVGMSSDERRELGARGRASLIGRFDLQSMGRMLSRVYREMLA